MGVTTQKENKIYVHVLNWGAPLLALPPIATKVLEAHFMADASPVNLHPECGWSGCKSSQKR
jgi:hypothetical protein